MKTSFIPPQPVRQEARIGLKLRHYYGRGGTQVGLTRAHQLDRGDALSLKTVKRMHSFFSRHRKNRRTFTKSGDPGNGTIAWLLWGGDSGAKWAKSIVRWAKKEGING